MQEKSIVSTENPAGFGFLERSHADFPGRTPLKYSCLELRCDSSTLSVSLGFLLCKSLWIIISAGLLEHVNYRPKLINVMHTEHSSGAFGQGFSEAINVEHSNRDQREFHNRQLGLVNTAIDGKIADHSYLKQSDLPSSVIASSHSSHLAVMHHSSQLTLGEFPSTVLCFLSIYNQKTSRQSLWCRKQLWCSICFICIVTNSGVNQASLHAKEAH